MFRDALVLLQIQHVNVGGRRETEICHHNLKRRCRKGRSCSRLHPVNKTYETSSPIQLVSFCPLHTYNIFERGRLGA